MRVVLLGAPGVGKGTQSELLAKDFKIPKISTGDMLRAAIAEGTSIGQQVKEVIAAGQLVSETLVNELVKARIVQPDCAEGYLLDGYPRTLFQAESLDGLGIVLDAVIEIDLSDQEIIARLEGRRIHVASGRVYHTVYNPPRVSNQDDETGEPLLHREDDQLETIQKRLAIYHQQTEPLVTWYRARAKENKLRYIQIQGTGTVKTVYERIREALLAP